MSIAAQAAVEPVDPVFVGLINPESFVETAAKLRGLACEHGQVDLGTFELSSQMIEDVRRMGMWWDNGDPFYGRDLCVLSGPDQYAADRRWEIAWPRDGTPIELLAYVQLYQDERAGGVYAMPFVRRPGKRWQGCASFHSSSLLFLAFMKHCPEKCSEFLRSMAGIHQSTIVRFEELGYGPIKSVWKLFSEFSEHHPMRVKLAQSPLSPFRPEKVWGLYAPEALWPALLESWAEQLRTFKKAL